jgi:hypothetical protein
LCAARMCGKTINVAGREEVDPATGAIEALARL